ncbi:hypothetical protein LIER_20506 [Lithospermum erythrorhizon]|uniref:RNase H type-1 domain-containing protein n=1 Tax=Lithospermum erythrorhizon TaxID=34254 RepID=A0AAV3QP67_LITER
MSVDGARIENGSGARILIHGLDDVVMEYVLRFTFPTTNNEVEYEALVAGLVIVKSSGINHIWVKGDIKLIMDQNEEADHLLRLTTTYYDELPKGVYVEIREKPAYEEIISMPILEEPED